MTVAERLWAKTERTESGCWLWHGGTNGKGYGRLSYNGRGVYVHRLSYTIARGPIPAGMQLDHLCRVRNCVNPDHLETVTPAENVRRWARLITHCPKGHAYDATNTVIGWRGERRCRECLRAFDKRRRAA